MRVWALPPQSAPVQAARLPHAAEPPGSAEQPLYHSLVLPEPETSDPEPAETLRPWRATGERLRPPADAFGSMVHHAVQRWSFPGDPDLPRLLETDALEAGLAEMLLARLQRHPL